MAVSIRALLIDMDGVLYQGEQPIPGAAETIEWLNGDSIPHLFVTNTTSRPRTVLVEKLARLGIHTTAERILTPPIAAAAWLREHVSGPIALFVPEATREEFADLPQVDEARSVPAAAVVIGDLGPQWDFHTLNRAFRDLMHPSRPPLIALGMTRYWQAEDGLRLDTAPFVVALEYAIGRQALVLGKPAQPFFHAALVHLGLAPGEVCMIGDDIRSDIGGAQESGMRAVLVRTGKYRPEDLQQEIEPLDVLDSIATLPRWWKEHQRQH